MSTSILTRLPAADDIAAGEPEIRLPSTSPSPSTTATADSLDNLWADYEQYLAAVKQSEQHGMEIYPQPAYVVKASLLPAAANKSSSTVAEEQKESLSFDQCTKLFINICTDEAVDAPAIAEEQKEQPLLDEALRDDSTPASLSLHPPRAPAPPTPVPGSLRLPLSVGPLTPCVDHSGQQALSVDVVIHPDALNCSLYHNKESAEEAYRIALGQAALIAKRDGVAPIVQTPQEAEAKALMQLKRTVTAFAINRIQEKYKLNIDLNTEPKFPKLVYKGSLPPPAQRIRRIKKHNMQTTQQQQATPQKHAETSTQQTMPSKQVEAAPQSKVVLVEEVKPAVEEAAAVVASSPQQIQSSFAPPTQQPPITPLYKLIAQERSTKQLSSKQVDATITATDVSLTTLNAQSVYQLQVLLPVKIDDQAAAAKFNKTKHRLTLTLPVLRNGDNSNTSVETASTEPLTAAAVPLAEDANLSSALSASTVSAVSAPAPACAVDWSSRLQLTNSFISQTCL